MDVVGGGPFWVAIAAEAGFARGTEADVEGDGLGRLASGEGAGEGAVCVSAAGAGGVDGRAGDGMAGEISRAWPRRTRGFVSTDLSRGYDEERGTASVRSSSVSFGN
jgi:hypothetical protein